MLFEVIHRTKFVYSAPVYLEPHLLRLRPRCDGSQRLIDFSFTADPQPLGVSELIELDGNSALRFWFSGLTDHLTFETRFKVETLRNNPWGFLPVRDADSLPISYPEPEAQYLLPCRLPSASSEPVARLAEQVSRESGGATIPFLSKLASTVHERCTPVFRDGGWPLPPEETLARGEGSCRDLAVLFMDAVRWMGLAARFVSGYQEGDPDQERRDMHAWAEVYIPGGGWRGYDPTHGLAVATSHVAVASGVTPPDAAPVLGTYRGTGVTSEMTAEIHIKTGGS